MSSASVNDQPAKKTQIKLFLALAILCIVMLTITFRDTKISAKNLEVQQLKKDYKKIVSEVNLVNIDVEAKYNLTSVEEYAKQKLGMQKPDIKQIIYVDTRIDNYMESNKEYFWESIFEIFKNTDENK